MESKINELEINGVVYVPKGTENTLAPKVDGMEYVIVRTYSAGVFAGWLESRNGMEGIIRNSRRLWYWDGACSLSQLAVDGTSKPSNCKFAVVVDKTELTQIVEIISVTEKAKKSIESIGEWKC